MRLTGRSLVAAMCIRQLGNLLPVGFGLSALGAWGVGIVLDLAGGPNTGSGWLAVFWLLAS
jgi:hypothetical protein